MSIFKNSIFASTDNEYEYISPSKKKKMERENKEYEASIKEKEDKLHEVAGKFIPYSGGIMHAVIHKDTSMLQYEGYCYRHGWNTFIGLLEIIEEVKDDTWHEVITSDGRVFYTTPFGVVHVCTTTFKEDQLELHGRWIFPTLEWLIESYKNREYLNHIPSMLNVVESNLPEEIEKRKLVDEERSRLYIKGIIDKATSLLVQCGEKIDEVSTELASFIIHYDYTWEYSDDHAMCLRYSSKLRVVESHLKNYPKLKVHFDNSVKEYWTKTRR